MSEYADQLKAFFHYTFQHAFAFEFGIRILVEILVLLVIVYFILKPVTWVARKIIRAFSVVIDFFTYDIVFPIGKAIADQFAYKIGSPKWQERAENIKQAILKHDEKQKAEKDNKPAPNKKKRSYAGYYVFAFIIFVGYLESFHYLLPNVKNNYPVFFVPEKLILESENFWENVVFETDENTIPCFYDFVHEDETSN